MENLKYIIEDSTIAELLGVQNFSTDEAAVLELVKNAYDANALNLTLEFIDKTLKITDDGNGMDLNDIKKHWMHIGKSSKGYNFVDSNSNVRVLAGSKGVGRFALSRLGKNVKLYSKKNQKEGVIWETDWNQSTLDIDNTLKNKGTCILINNLREKWTIKRIKKLNTYLEKTYNDTTMKIRIIANEYDELVNLHFPNPEPGRNCRSNIILQYNDGELYISVISNEFDDEAIKYCQNIDLNLYNYKLNIFNEFSGSEFDEVMGDNLVYLLKKLGKFSANLFFNLNVTNYDKEKFLYKYLSTPENIESGVILYRNAFSISSFEGEKDWLGLGKRSRKSPAAASHPTGSWRVRENQVSGYVLIDKQENEVLQDLMNRQGIDENIYYRLFVQIILAGIREFERYRQSIVREISKKNKNDKVPMEKISDKIVKDPKNLDKLNDSDKKQLVNEIRSFKQDSKKFEKEKLDVEERYKYDVRILNALATSGMKATSIAHEINNDRNQIEPSYDDIIKALKKYGIWNIVNSPENRKIACEDIPSLLENNYKSVKKILSFIDAILEKIEKKQFFSECLNVKNIINKILENWKKDYAWLNLDVDIDDEIEFNISKDTFYTIFDNLILNSVQQNNILNELRIKIAINKDNEKLKIVYSDNGKGLSKKYLDNPKIILEPHQTSRENGHGLGMWIINNTINLQKGKIIDISGKDGFKFTFEIEETI
ncbi:ATP-binding protein [Pasteurella canis]|uniref:ATP-binding protein n=1 Tax=Pasteurella canis TaxID=753 RepID=UPI0013279C7D|nr:sensor histidine kinase [Pasteurella canis]MXN88470.1 ATP-binding protein [Pasteurella canis]UDW82937.1 ATP-binding protein [Pasteurella canis]